MRHILIAAAALFVTASAACAAPSPVPDGFTSACEPVVGLRLAAGLRPAAEVDFVGFRIESTQLVDSPAGAPVADGPCPVGAACPPRPTAPGSAGRIAQWSARFSDDGRGVACSGASNRAECEKRVANIRLMASECDGFKVVPKVMPAPGGATRPTGNCTMSYLVYTRGDEVGTVVTSESARTFLGDINSPQEAILLAKLGGEGFSCDATSPAAYTPASDGYELSSSTVSVDRSGTPIACQRRILQVTKDGIVRFLRQEDC